MPEGHYLLLGYSYMTNIFCLRFQHLSFMLDFSRLSVKSLLVEHQESYC